MRREKGFSNILDQQPLSAQVSVVDYSLTKAFFLHHTASLPGKDVTGTREKMVICIQMSLLKSDEWFTQDSSNPRYGIHQPLGTDSESLTWGKLSPVPDQVPSCLVRALRHYLSQRHPYRVIVSKYNKHAEGNLIMVSVKEEDGQSPQQYT